MNTILKLLISCILLFCGLFVWIGMAIVGFFFAFTNWSIIYSITPFVGLISVFCIMRCAWYVLFKSDPIGYMNSVYDRIEAFFGKEKI